MLGGQAGDRADTGEPGLKATGAFPDPTPTITGGSRPAESFFHPNAGDTPAQELAYARQHFFLPRRYRDPFGQVERRVVDYDAYDLLMIETRDALGNTCRAVDVNDYRVLQPRLVTDPTATGPKWPSTRSAWWSAPRSWARTTTRKATRWTASSPT